MRLLEDKTIVVDAISSTIATTSLRIRIPAVSIDASVESVGLTSTGALDTPKDPAVAGLFKIGKYPGEVGTTVINGHFGWSKNVPAVFDRLASVRVGDKIYIDEGTSQIVFIVRGTHLYSKNEIAPEVFYSSDDKAHLNLITCSGFWDEIDKSYSDRWVVFSDREE